MIVQTNAVFLSNDVEEFTNKQGENISFQRVCFMPAGDTKPMTLGALIDLDFSNVEQLETLTLTVDIYTDPRTNYLKGRVTGFERFQ